MAEVAIYIRSTGELHPNGGHNVEIEVSHDNPVAYDWADSKPPFDAPREVQLAYIALEAIRRATPEDRAHCPRCLSKQVYAAPESFECAKCGFIIGQEDSNGNQQGEHPERVEAESEVDAG